MTLKKLVAALPLLAAALAFSGCKQVPFHILYLSDEGCVARTADGDPIDPLLLFPTDKVVWVNLGTEKMTIEFETALIFGRKTAIVHPGKRLIMTVQKDATGTINYEIDPCKGEKAPPRINIGEGTPKTNVTDPP